MYDFLGWVQLLANLAVLGLTGMLAWERWRGGSPARRHRANKGRLRGTIEPRGEERVAPREAARRNLEFLGLPSVEAGDHVTDVPTFDPGREGSWEKTREVITSARAVAYTQQGAEPVEIIELSGGYLLVACAGKALILRKYALSAPEEGELQRQRQEAVDRGDPVMESFAGHSWEIRSALGKNMNPRPGERACSFIQVLSRHPELEKPDGPRSILPAYIMDGNLHDYYDVRARNEKGGILYGFYVGGAWNCYLGRVLDEPEAERMKAV